MRCINCPLSFWEETICDPDLVCAATFSYVCLDGSCSRTNSWIKKQSRKDLQKKWIEKELASMEEFDEQRALKTESK